MLPVAVARSSSDGNMFIFMHRNGREKYNNTTTTKSERKIEANNLTKQIKPCKPNAICYVLPVLWMTSRFHTMGAIGPNQMRRVSFVQFARWRHRRQSLPSPTASCFIVVDYWITIVQKDAGCSNNSAIKVGYRFGVITFLCGVSSWITLVLQKPAFRNGPMLW